MVTLVALSVVVAIVSRLLCLAALCLPKSSKEQIRLRIALLAVAGGASEGTLAGGVIGVLGWPLWLALSLSAVVSAAILLWGVLEDLEQISARDRQYLLEVVGSAVTVAVLATALAEMVTRAALHRG
jgi:hypothetical protein